MAKEVLELTVKSNIGKVTKETDDLGKSIGKASDETKDLDKRLEETGRSGSKGFRAIGTAVKRLWNGFKSSRNRLSHSIICFT
jgi:flagellar capping protein FliD